MEKSVWVFFCQVWSNRLLMLIFFLGVVILLSVAGFQVIDPVLGGKESVDVDLP